MRCGTALAALVWLAGAAASCHHQQPPAAAAPQVTTPDSTVSLRANLARLLERESPNVPNECTRGGFLVAAVRHGTGEVEARARRALQALLAKPLAAGAPDCLLGVAAKLVPLLVGGDRAATVDALLRSIEAGRSGTLFTNEALQPVAAVLDAGQAARLERLARDGRTSCCTRAIVLSHLARTGRVALADAIAATKSCPDHCLTHDESVLLPLLDRAAKDDLLRSELELLDFRTIAFRPGHLYVLATSAPYLEDARRHEILAAAFRAMPAVGAEKGQRYEWGDLPPEFHFWAMLTKVAPYVTPDLVEPALHSVPETWPAETRAQLVGELAAGLPATVRRQKLTAILAAIPGPAGSLAALRARLMLASELPAEDVRATLERFLALETEARGRVDTLSKLVALMPAPDRAALCVRLEREIERLPTPEDRGSAATAVLDALAGPPAR